MLKSDNPIQMSSFQANPELELMLHRDPSDNGIDIDARFWWERFFETFEKGLPIELKEAR